MGGIPAETRLCRREVGTYATALCHPGSTLVLQTIGAYCAQHCGLTGLTAVNKAFSPIACSADGGIFIPIFPRTRKEEAAMTMPKWEVNSIWSKVREDRDIDDLIFNYEAYHTGEDDTCSDR